MLNPLEGFFGIEGYAALYRNPGPGYNTILLRLVPGDVYSALTSKAARQFVAFYVWPGMGANPRHTTWKAGTVTTKPSRHGIYDIRKHTCILMHVYIVHAYNIIYTIYKQTHTFTNFYTYRCVQIESIQYRLIPVRFTWHRHQTYECIIKNGARPEIKLRTKQCSIPRHRSRSLI